MSCLVCVHLHLHCGCSDFIIRDGQFVLVVLHAVKCVDDRMIVFKGRAIILAFIVGTAILPSV